MSKSDIPTPTGAAAVDPSNADTLTGHRGFDQFHAQGAADTAPMDSPEREVAAQQAAQFRANAQLEKDEWKTLDTRLTRIAQQELVLVNDLLQAGLTTDEDLATLVHEWQGTGEFTDADIDMAAETASSEDTSTFSLNGTPLPIVHKSFHIARRTLLASRRRGTALDTANQSKAARKVMEALDGMVANGWSGRLDGYSVYGYTNHPNRNLVSGSNWSASTTTQTEIRNDILNLVEALENDNYGPEGTGYWAYFGRTAYQQMRRVDTATDQERSTLERLNDEFGDMVDIRRSDALAPGEGVMLKPTEDVVQLANASDIQNVEWTSEDGFKLHMKVMASMTPILKADDAGQMGLAHITGLTG